MHGANNLIFRHANVASCLKAMLEERRERDATGSLRGMAKALGLSAAYLSQVMNQKRFLSPERALEIGRKLGLNDGEARYFYLLAQRDSAPSPEMRAQFDKELNDLSLSYAEEAIDADHFRAISDWFHVAILEMSYLSGFRVTPEAVAERLGISMELAKGAIERLERLGFLHKSADGSYAKSGQNVVFRTARTNEAFARFHRQMIGLALAAVDHQPVTERVIMSQTFCIEESQLAEARDVTRQYLQRMAGLFEKASRHTKTYQLNVQFFDLTDGRAKG